MKYILHISLLILPCILFAGKLEQKIQEFSATGRSRAELLESLTYDDIPKELRTTKRTELGNDKTTIYFSRGDDERLKVETLTLNEKTVTILDILCSGELILRVSIMNGTTVIPSPHKNSKYSYSVSIKEDKSVLIAILEGFNPVDVIMIQGEESHLIDDLEFLKNSLAVDAVINDGLKALEGHEGEIENQAGDGNSE